MSDARSLFTLQQRVVRKSKTLVRQAGLHDLPLTYEAAIDDDRVFLTITCKGGWPDEDTERVMMGILREAFESCGDVRVAPND